MPGSSLYVLLLGQEVEEWLQEIELLGLIQFWPELGPLNEESLALGVDDVASIVADSRSRIRSRLLVGDGRLIPFQGTISMADGSGWKISRNPVMNPDFALLLPGADAGDGVVVSTMVSSTNESASAQKTFHQFKIATKRMCAYRKGFYVSSNALALHRNGLRFQTHAGETIDFG